MDLQDGVMQIVRLDSGSLSLESLMLCSASGPMAEESLEKTEILNPSFLPLSSSLSVKMILKPEGEEALRDGVS